jgi:hypothetical protein
MTSPRLLLIASTISILFACAPGHDREASVQRLQFSSSSSVRFGRVVGVAELADGKWLIGDFDERSLRVYDPVADGVVNLGQMGPGPGEYPSLAALWAIGGDSILMVNQFARRWDVISAGRLSGSVPTVGFPGTSLISFDTLGGLVQVRPGSTPEDSQLVVRITREGAIESVLTRLAPPPAGYPRTPPPYQGQWDEALLAPDGWVAIRRTDPYRIDWIDPNGSVIEGEPLADERIPVDSREKEYMLSTMSPGRREQVISDPQWPDFVPPVGGAPMRISPHGEAVVERSPLATLPGRVYDLVGRDGKLVKQVVMDRKSRILGIGRKAALIGTEGDDGLLIPAVVDWSEL